MGTQADLSHLLCASAAAALQPDPPHRNACRYCGQDLRHPETIAVEKSDERLPGLHSPWAFQVSTCYWNLQPHPSWSSPCCSICPTALYATQIGILQHTSDIRCLTRHLIPLYVWRPSTMHALSHPLLRLPLPICESILLAATPLPKVWEAKTWDVCLCQVFPRWRDLALLKPFQPMFPEVFPSPFPSDMGQDHNYDLQFFHNLGCFWSEKAITFSSQRNTSHDSGGGQWILFLPWLCGYSWVLRSPNSCETDVSGLVRRACKPARIHLCISGQYCHKQLSFLGWQEICIAICRHTTRS